MAFRFMPWHLKSCNQEMHGIRNYAVAFEFMPSGHAWRSDSCREVRAQLHRAPGRREPQPNACLTQGHHTQAQTWRHAQPARSCARRNEAVQAEAHRALLRAMKQPRHARVVARPAMDCAGRASVCAAQAPRGQSDSARSRAPPCTPTHQKHVPHRLERCLDRQAGEGRHRACTVGRAGETVQGRSRKRRTHGRGVGERGALISRAVRGVPSMGMCSRVTTKAHGGIGARAHFA